MNTFIELVKKLESATGYKNKVEILKQYKDDEDCIYCISATYNPFITFGIKEIPKALEGDGCIDFKEFKKLLELASTRELTGNLLKAAIYKVKCGKKDNWIVDRILKKDLRAGVSIKTVAKVFPIVDFNVALCEKADDFNVFDQDEEYISQVKLDGVRTVAFVNPSVNRVEYLSRQGHIVEAFNGVFDRELLEMTEKLGGDRLVFDGEVVGDSWNQTISAKSYVNENRKAKEGLKYYVFDYLPYDEWVSKFCKNKYSKRLFDIDSVAKFDKVQVAKWQLTKGRDKIEEFYRKCLDEGYEGIVVKKPQSYYNFKKSKNWIKIKPKIDLDGEIVEVIEGEGKYKGMLGAILVKGLTDNNIPFVTKVGSGFNDEQRKEYWEEKDNIVGKTVEIEAQELSTSGKNTSVRFPVFKWFRLDK